MEQPYINVHCHQSGSHESAIEIINRFPNEVGKINFDGYYSIGIHPWHIHRDSINTEYRILEDHIKNPNCLAIGEIGLDRITVTSFAHQQEVFKNQLTIAEMHSKPAVIHCVKAYSEIIAIKKKRKSEIPWVIHGFNENETIGQNLMSLGCYLSFGHVLFNDDSKAVRWFKRMNPDKVLFETDDEAGLGISEVYKKAADLLGKPLAELKEQICKNFNWCFKKEDLQ